MKKYGIKGEDAKCLIDKSSKDVDKEVNELSKKLRVAKKSNPIENILTVVLFAGRGMFYEGYQVLLYDEYDPSNGFFKKFVAEKKICSWAEIYHNAYILCIMSCDSNIYNPEKHNFTCYETIKVKLSEEEKQDLKLKQLKSKLKAKQE